MSLPPCPPLPTSHLPPLDLPVVLSSVLLPLSDPGVLAERVPACVFTAPEVARVGFTEAQARANGKVCASSLPATRPPLGLAAKPAVVTHTQVLLGWNGKPAVVTHTQCLTRMEWSLAAPLLPCSVPCSAGGRGRGLPPHVQGGPSDHSRQ
jgi:hypothetical protein